MTNPFFCLSFLLFVLCSCQNNRQKEIDFQEPEPIIIEEFGFQLNNYHVVRDTVQRGNSFGQILEKNGLSYPKIYAINEVAKKTFNFA